MRLGPDLMASGKTRFLTTEEKAKTTLRAKKEGLCRWCGLDVKRLSTKRRTFCSDECVHEFNIRSSSSYIRQYIAKRDKYICQICGLDCYGFLHKLRCYVKEQSIKRPISTYEDRKELEIEFFDMYNMEWVNTRNRSTLYDIDHINPVIKGGAQCGEENLRTLCLRCHRIETARLRKELRKK